MIRLDVADFLDCLQQARAAATPAQRLSALSQVELAAHRLRIDRAPAVEEIRARLAATYASTGILLNRETLALLSAWEQVCEKEGLAGSVDLSGAIDQFVKRLDECDSTDDSLSREVTAAAQITARHLGLKRSRAVLNNADTIIMLLRANRPIEKYRTTALANSLRAAWRLNRDECKNPQPPVSQPTTTPSRGLIAAMVFIAAGTIATVTLKADRLPDRGPIDRRLIAVVA